MKDLLEAMTVLDIPLDDTTIVLSNDHIPATTPIPNLPFELDLTIGRSLDSGINEYFDSAIELQISVLYEFDVSHRCSDSPNDDFLLVESIIGVDFGIPLKYDLPIYRSANFGVGESPLVDYAKVRYTIEDFIVDDTHIQVTINRSIPLNLLHIIMVLLFL